MTTKTQRKRPARTPDASIDKLTKLVETLASNTNAAVQSLTERVDALAQEVTKPKGIPMTKGPEGDLQAYLAGMQRGEERGGIKSVTDFFDPDPDSALQPNDIVRLNESVETSDFQHKVRAFRTNLKLDSSAPLYGEVLQLIGPTRQQGGRGRGPRKYKVHIAGANGLPGFKDGFTENELILERRAR